MGRERGWVSVSVQTYQSHRTSNQRVVEQEYIANLQQQVVLLEQKLLNVQQGAPVSDAPPPPRGSRGPADRPRGGRSTSCDRDERAGT